MPSYVGTSDKPFSKMKGAGEPSIDHDFQPGEDILEDIRNGPKAALRMEFELFGRLAAQMEIFQTWENAEVY
jgi:hypothetical protein